MLGHDCHSIVAGTGHADAMIAELKSYIEKGYDLILTSHYTPEDLKDAETKIAYLENLKRMRRRRRFQSRGRQTVSAVQRPELSGYDGRLLLRLKIRTGAVKGAAPVLLGTKDVHSAMHAKAYPQYLQPAIHTALWGKAK